MRSEILAFGRNRRGGMTLVEVVIAVALAAMLSIAMYGSAVYTMRQTAKNVEHIYAVQLASSEAAAVRAASFSRLAADPATIPANAYEKRFAQTRTIQMDPNDPNSAIFTVSYEKRGAGPGVLVSGSTTYLHLPAGSAIWTANLMKDHLLVIVGGDGANQVMYIRSHTATENGGPTGRRVAAVLSPNLDGTAGGTWASPTPGASSPFAVDYGLYCDVVVQWDGGAGYKTVKETVYVPSSQ